MKGIYLIGEEVIMHDPGPEMLRMLAQINPLFRLQSIQPGETWKPKFQKLRENRLWVNQPLLDMSEEQLIGLLAGTLEGTGEPGADYLYSILDVLQIQTFQAFSDCRLCGLDCRVNRYQVAGRCGLQSEAFISTPFIHIAEEAPINPACVANFRGCALRCIYCIEHELWETSDVSPAEPRVFWADMAQAMTEDVPVNTLEFTNPTESLSSVIGILSDAPADFNCPVVLNCHLYGSRLFYDIADMITDVWLVDLRYGNDECAKALSGVDEYMSYAKIGLDVLRNKAASRVIVRILVLPGHASCCHEPAVRLLSKYKDRVWVSILDQFVPEHQVYLDPTLNRRPTKEEISQVETLVADYGLRNIGGGCEEFWSDNIICA
jgi:putative pyruvate formate lyase activating enzyme